MEGPQIRRRNVHLIHDGTIHHFESFQSRCMYQAQLREDVVIIERQRSKMARVIRHDFGNLLLRVVALEFVDADVLQVCAVFRYGSQFVVVSRFEIECCGSEELAVGDVERGR